MKHPTRPHPALTSTALLALVLAAPARASEPEAIEPSSAEVRAEPDRVPLGAPFELVVSIRHPADQRYELVPPTALGDFSLLGTARRREDGKDGALTVFTLRLSLFELGMQEVPPLQFDVMTPAGVRRFRTGPVRVEGLATLAADDAQGAELRGLKAPEDVPVLTLRLLWQVLGVLLGLGLLVALWRWWRSRPPKAAPALPLLPLEARTRGALEALRAERLPEAGRQKEFYSRLADILRGYVGELYRVEALESTTVELAGSLGRVGAPSAVIGQLKELLEEADLVKFAKMQVDPTACDSALDAGHRLVERTHAAAPPLLSPTIPPSDVAPGPQLP